MHERDAAAVRAGARLLVHETNRPRLQVRDRPIEIRHANRDMVQARPAPAQEGGQRRFDAVGLHELDRRLSAADEAHPHALIAHRLEGAEKHTSLMEGIVLGRGGEARRKETASETDNAMLEVLKKAAQTRRHLEGLAASPVGGIAGFEKVIATLGEEVKRLPADTAARSARR